MPKLEQLSLNENLLLKNFILGINLFIVIKTLCMSGQGWQGQIKNFLVKNFVLGIFLSNSIKILHRLRPRWPEQNHKFPCVKFNTRNQVIEGNNCLHGEIKIRQQTSTLPLQLQPINLFIPINYDIYCCLLTTKSL